MAVDPPGPRPDAPSARPLPVEDLEHVLGLARGDWEALRGGRLFVTGGTGFWGSWMLESLVHADRSLGLGLDAVVLTRDPEAYLSRRPGLATARSLSFIAGDVRDFEFPPGRFTHVIHAATAASVALNLSNPAEMRDVIVRGMQRVLEFTVASGARRLLLASSGAVYGRQRPGTTHIAEDDPGLHDPIEPASAYAEGKREAERLCLEAASGDAFEPVIARGFAFLGPLLPMDGTFAAGNFLRDALRGGPIQVSGDGTACRSYLYAADLSAWLWTLLARGASGRAYNVGSEARVTVGQLAHLIATIVAPGSEVRFAKRSVSGAPPEQYIPCTRRAREELGLSATMNLEEAIRRTVGWVRGVR